MSETIITVQGQHSESFAAERARLSLEVGFEAADRDGAYESTATASAVIRDELARLHDATAGPVTLWSSETLRVWSSRPWSDTGEQLPLIYHASVSIRASFSDFAALSTFIELASITAGVRIDGISWELTKARRQAVISEVRSRAVKDAVTKATIYAQSIGLGTVRAIAIADPGMLGDSGGTGGGGAPYAAQMMRAGADSIRQIELRPEDITVEASVDARFVAS